MLKIPIKHRVWVNNRPGLMRVRAFTVLESLLVLSLLSGTLMLFSGQVKPIFSKFRQELFFLEFEHLYRETQQLSQAQGQQISLVLTKDRVSNGYQTIALPPDLSGPDQVLVFDQVGGNHSLSKLVFETGNERISYQLYLGSGKYKKTKD